jgi:phenylacetate-CoA ligase
MVGVTCHVEVLEPGGLPRSEGKAVRVRDLRKGE